MTTIIQTMLTPILLLLQAMAITPQDMTQPDLTWLSGCWQDDSHAKEVWSEPEGDMLFGYGVVVENGRVAFFERLRIEQRYGKLVYIAAPFGSDATTFILEEAGDNQISFINKAHDYPQRIKYQRKSDTLTAAISLADGTKMQTFIKTAC